MRVRSFRELFRTAWFVESLLTELVIALVVRTARPFYRSRPGILLLASTTGLIVITFAIPFLPIADVFGFVPLSGVAPSMTGDFSNGSSNIPHDVTHCIATVARDEGTLRALLDVRLCDFK